MLRTYDWWVMKFIKIILFLLGAIVVANASGKSSVEKYVSTRANSEVPGRKSKKIKNYTHTAPAKGTQVGKRTTSLRSYRHAWAS
jgi:hypothetical protein